MDEDIQNSTDAQNSHTPYPAPAHFDANMIAAAQPVEPLSTGTTRRRQLLRGRWGLLAGLLIGGLLSAAIVGMMLGLRGATEPATVETQTAPPVVSQPTQEAPKPSAPVHQSAKSSETPARKVRPAAPTIIEVRQSTNDKTDQKPVARKVGEIVYGRGDRKEKKEKHERRRHQDDDH